MTRGRLTIGNINSQDHRGTPEAPGRVVTLIEREYWQSLTDHHQSAPERVWGVAYRIEREKVAEVKDYLDIREINGYSIQYASFYPAKGESAIRTLVYIGTPDNDQFTGVQEPQALSEHITRSHGPSGPNIEYLLSLEAALDALGPEAGDEHVSDLSSRARAILGLAEEPASNIAIAIKAETAMPSEHEPFKQEHSIDEQEETEKDS
jgi:cation transport regulator ChaC